MQGKILILFWFSFYSINSNINKDLYACIIIHTHTHTRAQTLAHFCWGAKTTNQQTNIFFLFLFFYKIMNIYSRTRILNAECRCFFIDCSCFTVCLCWCVCCACHASVCVLATVILTHHTHMTMFLQLLCCYVFSSFSSISLFSRHQWRALLARIPH